MQTDGTVKRSQNISDADSDRKRRVRDESMNVHRVSLKIRNVPDGGFLDFIQPKKTSQSVEDEVVFDKGTGVAVGLRAMRPLVPSSVLIHFLNSQVDRTSSRNIVTSQNSSDSPFMNKVWEADPLDSGKIVSFVEWVNGKPCEFFYLWSNTADEFIKFWGFSENGKFSYEDGVYGPCHHARRLVGREAYELYRREADKHRTIRNKVWSLFVDNNTTDVNASRQNEYFLRLRDNGVDECWLREAEANTMVGLPRLPPLEDCPIKRQVWERFKEAMRKDSPFHEHFNVRSIFEGMQRSTNGSDLNRTRDCVLWFLLKSGAVKY